MRYVHGEGTFWACTANTQIRDSCPWNLDVHKSCLCEAKGLISDHSDQSDHWQSEKVSYLHRSHHFPY